MISVGRIVYINGKPQYPSKLNHKSIVIMMKSHSKWWPLSPYYLLTHEGYILENYWQFSKVYANPPASRQTYSRYDSKIIWDWPSDVHLLNDQLTPSYYKWRKAGFNNEYAVRYPVGYNHRGKCLFSVDENDNRMSYIEARKKYI